MPNFIPGTYGADLIVGTSFDDVVAALTGVDTIYLDGTNGSVDGGNDLVRGGGGDDLIFAGLGNDQLRGDAGTDTIHGGGGNDLIFGDSGNPALVGEGDDQLYGDAGNDTIYGNGGNDSLYGGDDNDTLSGGLGNDLLDGGSGNNTALYQQNIGAVQVSLFFGTATGAFGNDTLVNIQNVVGGDFNDFIAGNQSDNMLWGGAGNDGIRGMDGADTIHGDAGSDTVIAGSGNDIVFGDADRDNLSGNDGDDWIAGGAGNDTMRGGAGADTFAFLDITDAGLTQATRDSVLDFEVGTDVFDLSALAASLGVTATISITGGFSSAPNWYLAMVDADSNGVNDFAISVTTTGGALSASDFILV